MRVSAVFLALALALAGLSSTTSTARADLGDESLGLNTHIPDDELLDMSVDVGVKWIRVDAVWGYLNPSAGTYSWDGMDHVVDEATARGLRVYMSLAYTPDWVTRVPRTRTDTYMGNDEPATSAEWVAFVEAAVAHYSARGVTHFGIWNEPNLDHFWETAGGVDAYVDKILIPGSDAVRRTCSSCFVLGPDLAHIGPYDVFLDRVLTRAIDSFDIFAHHLYNDWEENGETIFDGDRFLEALESMRFPGGRRGVKLLLDAHGWTGEVWITETGYKAAPGNAGEEAKQATYVRRVMEEQLSRDWWTNTFFYEISDCGIDQPGCTIDGYGITRPLHPASEGPRLFPEDYRQKPAYAVIRDFIDAHPEIVMSAPPPECGNGEDDDADGRVDSEDRGCTNGTDDDESDDPARVLVDALPAGAITIDGALGDWDAAGSVGLGAPAWIGTIAYGGAADLATRIRARFGSGSVFVAVEVDDDVHHADDSDDQLYLGDSLQIAFDVDADRTAGAYDDDDQELAFALVGGAPHARRFHGDGDDAWEVAIVRTGSTTIYELRLPASVLDGATLGDGARLGFTFLVNDDDGGTTSDGTGREGWLELTPGIGRGKDPYAFGDLLLTSTPTPPDGGVGSDGGTTPDGGVVGANDGGGLGTIDGGGGGGREPADDGCSCRAAGRPVSGSPVWSWTALLGLAGVLLARRRR